MCRKFYHYTYNEADWPTGTTYPDGEQVTAGYTRRGLPTTLTGDAPYITNATYDALAHLRTRAAGNDLTTTYAYYPATENNNRLKRIRVGNLLDLEYAKYDNAGNILTMIDRSPVVQPGQQTLSFTYDHLDRLTEATATGGELPGYTESYRYDEIGNITRRNGNAYTYDSQQPHAVTEVAANTYRYNDNGNMTGRIEGGVTYTQTWNFENKLERVEWANGDVRFLYDGDGNRLLKIEQPPGFPEKTTIYIGRHYEVEVGSVTIPTKYYFHDDTRVAMRRGGEVYYLHGDHLGSTSLTTDQNGDVVNEVRYRPYGREHWTNGVSPTDFGFTAQRHEASFSLIDYNARYYSPVLGRFISPDPIVPKPANPQNWNRYAYVSNNPLKYVDPSGHCQGLAGTAWDICATTVTSIAPAVHKANEYRDDIFFPDANTTIWDRVEASTVVGGGATFAAALSIEVGVPVISGHTGPLTKGLLDLMGIACVDGGCQDEAQLIKQTIEEGHSELEELTEESSPPDSDIWGTQDDHPPGWNENWEWEYGTRGQTRRWFDENGGEWRRHPPDPWHDEPHWDYNPWDEWNSPWENRDNEGNPMP